MKAILSMKRYVMALLSICALSLVALPLFFFSGCQKKDTGKSVLLAILARNKAHVLPYYLRCIDAQQYDKKLITVYINTNNNDDDTKKILQDWAAGRKAEYKDIIFESHTVKKELSQDPHDWTPTRFKVLAKIRNKSLKKAQEYHCDYYFVVDCDNFIAPCTLRALVEKDKPIIAPLLRSIPNDNDMYANFFPDINENGRFKITPDYNEIVLRKKLGTFQVPVAHCTYLVKSEYIDKLTYLDGTDEYEFLIFSKSARDNNVPQFLCNEHKFGVQLHPPENCSLQQEHEIMEAWVQSEAATFLFPKK